MIKQFAIEIPNKGVNTVKNLRCASVFAGYAQRYPAITKNEVLMFTELEVINFRPEPYLYYIEEELWVASSPSKRYVQAITK